jgi:magnesium-transporting ATPase (P-type)
MDPLQEQLDALRYIRNMMDRSKKFDHISGKAGVLVGTLSLIIVGITYWMLKISPLTPHYYHYLYTESGNHNNVWWQLMGLYSFLLLVATWIGYQFAIKNAVQNGSDSFATPLRQLLTSMLYPLLSGGAVCLVLLYHQQEAWLAPLSLIFYGLAMVQAGQHSFSSLIILGIALIVVGLLSAIFLPYALIGWALGFGCLHIIFGSYIYYRYKS